MANKNNSKLVAPWWLTAFSYLIMVSSVGYILIGLSGSVNNTLLSIYLVGVGIAMFYVSFGIRRMQYQAAVYLACIVGLGIAIDVLFTVVTGDYSTLPKDIVGFAIRISISYSIFDYIKKANNK